jgi:hypothetical protein
MAHREGLEPPTLWVETICAIHCATDAFHSPKGGLFNMKTYYRMPWKRQAKKYIFFSC